MAEAPGSNPGQSILILRIKISFKFNFNEFLDSYLKKNVQ